MLALAVLTLLLQSSRTLAERIITVLNRCPQPITLYINGQSQGSLATGGVTNRTFEDTFSGLMYTDANGGSATGGSTTRAGFYTPTNYYYIVRDPDHLNVGLSIVPKIITPSLLADSFCELETCDSIDCSFAYNTQPTSFPVPTTSPPQKPLAQCPGSDVGYTITFCPEKTFPPANGSVTIHPDKSSTKCLDVQGAAYADGTPVQIYDCNKTSAQRWILDKSGGNTTISLAGTGFCLDAGQHPISGTGLTIRPCIANSSSQTWVYTSADGHIRQFANKQCVDITDGILTNGNRIQSWTCIEDNLNQIWSTS